MARYRMNDLLRLADAPCSCGSPLRHVAEIVGRMDDCFHLPGSPADARHLRNVVLDASRAITDFRLIQQAPDEVQLILPPDLPGQTPKPLPGRWRAAPPARPSARLTRAAAAGAGQKAAPGGVPPARRGQGVTAAQAAAGAARTLTLRPSCNRATRNSTAIPPAIIAVSSRKDGPARTFATCAA